MRGVVEIKHEAQLSAYGLSRPASSTLMSEQHVPFVV
jgi:hypothetical protein